MRAALDFGISGHAVFFKAPKGRKYDRAQSYRRDRGNGGDLVKVDG